MPSPWQLGAALLRAPAVEVTFALRQWLRWSRGGLELPHEAKAERFGHLTAARRDAALAWEGDLRRRFDLDPLWARSTTTTWLGNLARLDALDRLAAGLPRPDDGAGTVHAIDIGSGDFHYATALQRWLARHGRVAPRHVVLRGLELDGHGIYRDGRARADHGRAHAAQAAAGTTANTVVRYEVADATARALPEQDVATVFFPFLGPYACLRWGLPLSRLRPRRLLARAVAAVRPGGWLVLANQTAAELERAERYLATLPVDRLATRALHCPYLPWAEQTALQVVTLWRRRG
jgi:nitrogen fixation protein FixH